MRFGICVLLVLAFIACKEEEEIHPLDDLRCEIIEPANDTIFLNESLHIQITNSHPGKASGLELYINNIFVASTLADTLDFFMETDTLLEKDEVEIKGVVLNTAGDPTRTKQKLFFRYRPPKIKFLGVEEIKTTQARARAVVEDYYGDEVVGINVCFTDDGKLIMGEKNLHFVYKQAYMGVDDTLVFNLENLKSDTEYKYRLIANSGTFPAYYDIHSFKTESFYSDTGFFTDLRDLNEYKTVTIGSQTWMAENLRYLDEVFPADSNGGKWVHDYNGFSTSEAKSLAGFSSGTLYSYEVAQDVCPAGWHLPSDDELRQLAIFVGADWSSSNTIRGEEAIIRLLAEQRFRGTNEAKLNIKAMLRRDADKAAFEIESTYPRAYFWTTNPAKAGIFWNDELQLKIMNENDGLSVRCVKD